MKLHKCKCERFFTPCNDCPTDTPVDYYRRKQQEVDYVIAKIEAHLELHKDCNSSCAIRQSMEKALERARYVGD